MTGEQLKQGRKRLAWTQQVAAEKLGVSQPYLSLLEKGLRPAPAELAKKAVRLYGAPPTALPLDENLSASSALNPRMVAADLAGLGYPGLSYLRMSRKRNPAGLLFEALGQKDLESRLVEALPWVVLQYPALDWNWLVDRAKLNDLQNRLGYVTCLASRLAQANHDYADTAALLSAQQPALEKARLAREDTLCHESVSEAEKSWLRKTRPPDAVHWNLLTDLRAEQLPYGG